MAIRMQQRRGTASQWTTGNPTLAAGEIGFETDTGKFKIGNGTLAWNSLKYFTDAESILGGVSGVDLPTTLDTLNEIAAALNDDPAFFSTMATNLSNHESDTTNVHGITDTSALATKTYADNAVSTHNSDTTGVHGISDTSALATKSGTEVFTNKTISYADNTITVQVNNVSDLTATAAELNTLDGITATTAELNILDGVTSTAAELNILDGVTASALELNILDGVTATTAELNILDGVTATAAELNILAGATLTTTELNYVDGVTSAIQTQLNAKADLASPTFTGTVTTDDLIVDGDFTVNGTNFAASATSITIEDNMVQLANQNAANTVDLGLVVGYNDGAAKHAGIVRDVSADKWKLFKGVTTEPATTVDFTQGSLDDIELRNLTATEVAATTLKFGGSALSVETELDKKTPELYTFTTDSTTARTLALTDQFKSLKFTSASATTVTVPTNASVAFPTGSYVELYQFGAGQVTVSPDSGVTIRSTDSQTKLRTQYSAGVLIKVDTNEWLLTGDLTA